MITARIIYLTSLLPFLMAREEPQRWPAIENIEVISPSLKYTSPPIIKAQSAEIFEARLTSFVLPEAVRTSIFTMDVYKRIKKVPAPGP